ncbi:U-reduvitoxin-Pr11a-like [Phlebotomus argentipes]|uniref:U-reduvitoxin-Pr11a-like n=1 Tax=Phlebotomus argentipes TaxID=94469 RepID=UPI0028937DCB|nr:U-reduvitoxin-Pr11a-like [Phlebotomus argentipes]
MMKFVVFSLLVCVVSLTMGQILKNDPSGKACVAGSSFKDEEDCNTCVCNAEGTHYFCTKKFCPRPQDVQGDDPQAYSCQPGSRFKSSDGCNWCTCSEDGKNSFCTLMACVNIPANAPMPYRKKRSENCTPGSTFTAPDGCNTCTCSPSGTAAFCTRMECPPKPAEATPYRKRRDTGN